MSTTIPAVTESVTTTSVSTLPSPTSHTKRPLTTADRCDTCGAQAYFRVVLASGELLFCAHHGRKNAAALERVALFIQDESARLIQES
ncbi:DUF7455 domain-containing protein [Actinomyces trachealis]|uniref:DUF7455 domain-containing protein n=1 Tax=Actinomyces trachealis TaxID=2763540 RepID=UPI0018C6758D|nr:hypothetical protein [Actinomyces trachealis]